MIENGLEIIFVVFYFCLELYFVVFPKKKLGIVNLTVGLCGLIIAGGSYALGNFPFAPYSCLVIAVFSVLCIAVGDKELL